MHLVGERLQDQDFDHTSDPAAFVCRFQESLQVSHCIMKQTY
jgi:phage-related protein